MEKRYLRILMENDDDSSTRSPEEAKRLLANGYMELEEKVKGFACGNCRWLDKENEFCEHKAIVALVSPNHGCCNHFFPGGEEPVFGSQK